MKKILLVLIGFIPILSFAQANMTKTITPMGSGMVFTPAITILGSTVGAGVMTIVYADTIIAGNLGPGRTFDVNAYTDITTGLSLLPALTVRLYIGTDSITLASSASLGISQTSAPIRIHVVLTTVTNSSQFVYAEILGTNQALVSGAAVTPKAQFLTQDFTTDKIIRLGLQLSSAVNLATVTLKVNNIVRAPY